MRLYFAVHSARVIRIPATALGFLRAHHPVSFLHHRKLPVPLGPRPERRLPRNPREHGMGHGHGPRAAAARRQRDRSRPEPKQRRAHLAHRHRERWYTRFLRLALNFFSAVGDASRLLVGGLGGAVHELGDALADRGRVFWASPDALEALAAADRAACRADGQFVDRRALVRRASLGVADEVRAGAHSRYAPVGRRPWRIWVLIARSPTPPRTCCSAEGHRETTAAASYSSGAAL